MYAQWGFNEAWDVEWDDYYDGLECVAWIQANPWISKICENYSEMKTLFQTIQAEDWRHGQCGGCI